MRIQALFVTECGCEQIVEIPEDPPILYRLPRIRPVKLFENAYDFKCIPSQWREFERERIREDGTAVYREVRQFGLR